MGVVNDAFVDLILEATLCVLKQNNGLAYRRIMCIRYINLYTNECTFTAITTREDLLLLLFLLYYFIYMFAIYDYCFIFMLHTIINKGEEVTQHSGKGNISSR